SPTRRKSGSRLSSSRKPWRTIWWSSASNRVKGMASPLFEGLDGQFSGEASAAAGLGFHVQPAVQQGGAFMHAGQAAGCAHRLGGAPVKAGPPVVDLEAQGLAVKVDPDRGLGNAGVAGDVGEGFLDDPEGSRLHLGREEPPFQPAVLERDVYLSLGGVALE